MTTQRRDGSVEFECSVGRHLVVALIFAAIAFVCAFLLMLGDLSLLQLEFDGVAAAAFRAVLALIGLWFALLAALVTFRALRSGPSVEVSDSGLVLRGIFRTRRLRWSEIVAIGPAAKTLSDGYERAALLPRWMTTDERFSVETTAGKRFFVTTMLVGSGSALKEAHREMRVRSRSSGDPG